MTLGPISSSEIHLLKKEIEAQGELLSQERLERIADTDQIEIELEAMRTALTKLVPEFAKVYEMVRAQNLPASSAQSTPQTGPKIKSG